MITSVNQTLTEIITLPVPEVAISTFRASLETDDTSPYYEADLCGSIEVTMTLSDGSELPEFMIFDESDLTFLVEATSNDEIGQYEVAINYNLANYPTHLTREIFNVLVRPNGINHPPYLRNVIGFTSKVSLNLKDDLFEFPLEIVDPDEGSLDAM